MAPHYCILVFLTASINIGTNLQEAHGLPWKNVTPSTTERQARAFQTVESQATHLQETNITRGPQNQTQVEGLNVEFSCEGSVHVDDIAWHPKGNITTDRKSGLVFSRMVLKAHREYNLSIVICKAICGVKSCGSGTAVLTVKDPLPPIPSPTRSVLTVHSSSANHPKPTTIPTRTTDKDGIDSDEDKSDSMGLTVIIPPIAVAAFVVTVVVATIIFGVTVYRRKTRNK